MKLGLLLGGGGCNEDAENGSGGGGLKLDISSAQKIMEEELGVHEIKVVSEKVDFCSAGQDAKNDLKLINKEVGQEANWPLPEIVQASNPLKKPLNFHSSPGILENS